MDPRRGLPGEPANEFNINEGAEQIKNTEKYVNRFSSDYQWDFQYAEPGGKAVNEMTHEARFSLRYYFKFMDNGEGVLREISANFDPIERDWEEAAFKFSSGK